LKKAVYLIQTFLNTALGKDLHYIEWDSKCLATCFFKYMNFHNQARLCLAIYDFEARFILSICLTFQGTTLETTGMRKI